MSWEDNHRGDDPKVPTVPVPVATSPDDPTLVEHGRIVDLLCEGQIYGLATGDLRSVKLDGVPVMNDDGSVNVRDVYLAMVYGSNAQPAIRGISDVESETTLQSKVTKASPVTASISGPGISACRVKVSVPALFSSSDGTIIAFQIDVYDGTSWATKVFPPGAPVGGGSTTLAVNGSAKTITRNAGSWITDGYQVGMTVVSSGFANTGNNQTLVVTGVTALALTFSGASGLVTESAANARYLTCGVLDGSLKGRFTSKYVKAFRVPLSGAGPWQVRLTRITADSTDATTLQNDLYFESITAITEARLRSPNTAKAAISVDAKQYSRVPTRTYRLKLALIQVPTNYDPTTRTYATSGPGTTGGAWDGTFKTAWSDNPAWCYYDMATHLRYGAGSSLSGAVNKWALYQIGQVCDGMVPDGKGGTEPRFRCNCFINSRQEGIKLLNYLASVFRGMAYWAAGTVQAIQDVDASPAALFTVSNVINGRFSYQGTARRARHTAAIIYWNDPANKYKRTPEYVEDQAGIARYGLNTVEYTAFGCTSQGQARRVGLWLLASELTETETVTFQTGMEGVVARPGEIVAVQDCFRTGTRAGGRIAASATGSITLDAPVTIAAGVPYQIACAMPDGTIQTRIVSNSPGTTTVITVGTAFSVAPQVQGQWVMISGDGSMSQTLYRIISIREQDGLFEVAALLHNAAKYAAIESGLTVSPGVSLATTAQSAVQGLAGGEALRLVGGIYQVTLLATWTPQPGAIGYSAFYSINAGPWEPMTVSASSAVLVGAPAGSYRIRVVAHYDSGIGPMAEASYILTGSSIMSQAVTGLTTVYTAGQLNLTWNALTITGLDYEIRMGSSWNAAKVLGRTANDWFETVSDGTYWVAPHFSSSYGTPASITVDGATLTKNVVATWDEAATGWSGTCSGGAAVHPSGLFIALRGTGTISSISAMSGVKSLFYYGAPATDGYYEIPAGHITDLGIAKVSTLSASYQAAVGSMSPADLVSRWTLVSAQQTIASKYAGLADAVLEYALAGTDGTFSTWNPFGPGQYLERLAKWRVHLSSTKAGITPLVSALVTTVDMPDRVDRYPGRTVLPAGITLPFATPFQAVQNVQVTIHDASPGDTWVRDSLSTTQLTGHITNGGSNVTRANVDITVQGY